MKLNINFDQYLELEKIAIGAFYPLKGFMCEDEFQSCVLAMRLPSGAPFPIPIYLDVDTDVAEQMDIANDEVHLLYEGKWVGSLWPTSIYKVDKNVAAEKIYGTNSIDHPGVACFMSTKEYFVGGRVKLHERASTPYSQYDLLPEDTRNIFCDLKWDSVAGFQTRNVPHRAHEYLQRVALELTDGLFIQPLVGKKKRGDYTPAAVIKGYETLLDKYFPINRARLGVLSTVMRYAGPREAVFHALVRRNYGCTHFIIGRDHAGVGNYYEKYAAHKLAKELEADLGINLLLLSGPFYCEYCESIVTEKTCTHIESAPEACHEISGTLVRKMIKSQAEVNKNFMRPDVLSSLKDIELFV
jgi:sulfate adenylyltransferase